MKKYFSFFIALFVLYSCTSKDQTTTETQAQLFFNGEILTMESKEPIYAEALVVQNGKIAFVGSKNEADSNFPNAKQIDLAGKTLLPGFIDPHSHFGMVSNTMGQVDLNSPPVGDVKTVADVLAKMKAYKEE